MNLILFLTFTCSPVTLVNKTSFPWNDHDNETLASAKKRCPQLDREYPCVGTFIKHGEQDYSVLCSRPLSIKED